MSTLFKTGLVAAMLAALLSAPTLASAASTAYELVAAGAPETSLLAQVASTPMSTASTQSLFADSVSAQAADTGAATLAEANDGMQSALSARALRNPAFGNLRGNADLLLWNLCAVVRAQQGHHAFDLIDGQITTVHLSEDIAKVSAVPLPGVVWLFVMGVMGLAGTRVTGIKGRKVSDATGNDSPREWPQLGGAVPA